MNIQGTATLPGKRNVVWNTLQDPEMLRLSIPGCEKLELVGPNVYRADLSVGVAAIKGKYSGMMTMLEQQPPETYKMQVEGKGAPGWVKATMTLTLAEQGDETAVAYEVDAQVGGLVASVGQRMLGSVAKMLLGDMFKRLGAEIQSHSA